MVHRRALVRRVGLLTSSGWVQHAYNRPAAPQAADIDLAADVFFSNNPGSGGYRGMNVVGETEGVVIVLVPCWKYP